MEKKQTQKHHSSVIYVVIVRYSLESLPGTKDDTRKTIENLQERNFTEKYQC